MTTRGKAIPRLKVEFNLSYHYKACFHRLFSILCLDWTKLPSDDSSAFVASSYQLYYNLQRRELKQFVSVEDRLFMTTFINTPVI